LRFLVQYSGFADKLPLLDQAAPADEVQLRFQGWEAFGMQG
jgi:hypothetical protein